MALNTDMEDDIINGATEEAPDPKSPLIAGSEGQTPDQAKMAGTPAQKAGAAISAEEQEAKATESTDAAADAKKDADPYRTKDYIDKTREPTPQDEQAREAAKTFTQDMKGMGAFGSRVQTIVEETLAGNIKDNTSEIEVGEIIEVNEDKIRSWAEGTTDGDALVEQLTKFKTDMEAGNTADAWVAMAESTDHFADIDSAYEYLADAFGIDESTIKNNIVDSIASDVLDPEDMTISNLMSLNVLDMNEFGFDVGTDEGLGRLESVLGKNWKKMTPGQIEGQMEATAQAEFSEVAGIRKQLQSGNLDPAQRQALAARLQQLASSSVMSAEATVEAEVLRHSTDDTIMFGDSAEELGEFLKDSNIKALVNNYYAAEERGEGDKWIEEHPGMGKWIQDMSTKALDDAKVIGDGAKAATSAHQTKLDAANKNGTTNLAEDPNMREALGIPWDLGPEGFTPPPNGMLANLDGPGAEAMLANFQAGDLTAAEIAKYHNDGGANFSSFLGSKTGMADKIAGDAARKILSEGIAAGKDFNQLARELGIFQSGKSLDATILSLENDMLFATDEEAAELKEEMKMLQDLKAGGTDFLKEYIGKAAGSLDALVADAPNHTAPLTKDMEDMTKAQQGLNAAGKHGQTLKSMRDDGKIDASEVKTFIKDITVGEGSSIEDIEEAFAALDQLTTVMENSPDSVNVSATNEVVQARHRLGSRKAESILGVTDGKVTIQSVGGLGGFKEKIGDLEAVIDGPGGSGVLSTVDAVITDLMMGGASNRGEKNRNAKMLKWMRSSKENIKTILKLIKDSNGNDWFHDFHRAYWPNRPKG